MSPVSFLPSHVYREAQLNRMQGKAGRIVVSWNQFARNLKEAFYLYSAEKQAEFYSSLEEIPRFIRKTLPVKPSLLAFSPYLMYLLIYSNYTLIRSMTGLEENRKPSITFLPWLEYMVFHFYPHRFLDQFATPILDFFAAIPYLVHFPLPFVYLLYLMVGEQRRKQLFSFIWCAGWVNLVAVFIQLIFPTAPPWFVDSAVFDHEGRFITSVPNEAGFHRIDALIGRGLFHKIYAASPLKFGSFPSLHVAWPAIILVSRPYSKRMAWIHVLWIIWAALYSNHHYAVDALGGIILVFIVNFSMNVIWSPFKSSTRMRTVVLKFLRLKERNTTTTSSETIHA